MTEGENNNSIGTWGALVGVIGGAALGYWAGRSNGPCGFGPGFGPGVVPGYGYGAGLAAEYNINNNFDQFEAGKTQAKLYAGLDYAGQAIAATRQDIAGLAGQMNANFQRLEDRQFDMMLAENTALKGELNTARTVLPITNQMTGMNSTINQIDRAFMPGYVRSVPLCNSCYSCRCSA